MSQTLNLEIMGPPSSLPPMATIAASKPIPPRITSIACQKLPRVIRPLKLNRYQAQSIAISERGILPRCGSWSPQPWFWFASVPQQLVDRGLGTGALVDALHDDGAGGRRADLAVLHRLARQRARHHHGIFRHLADKHLAGLAIDDLCGG